MKIINSAFFIVGLAIVGLLSGCGGEDNISVPWRDPAAVYFAYPYPGQSEVPVTAPLIVYFSEPLDQTSLDNIANTLQLTEAVGEDQVNVTHTVSSDRKSVMLRPLKPLTPALQYRVVGGDLSGVSAGVKTSVFDDFVFTTAGLQVGAKIELGKGFFDLIGVAPLDPIGTLGAMPFVDFSSFRLAFNYPLDPRSITYGDTIRVEKRLSEDTWALLESVGLFHQGRYLTLDPLTDLEAGSEYRLVLDGVVNLFGDTLPLIEREGLVPQNTAPRETAILRVGSLDSVSADVQSKLTGALLNSIPITSFVIGDQSATSLSGDLAANLGFVPNFVDAIPLRVPAGSTLIGTPVEINIVGQTAAGIETGNVIVTLLSDASGYLLPNPFSDANDAPRYAVLTMDAAMTAQGLEANAALSQNLLNIQIVGLAIVEEGVLTIDAVGVVEPEVLGLEKASGLISFRMEAYKDQRNAPQPTNDSSPLQLHSWTPGENYQSNARPGDAIILNFTKPISPDSVLQSGAITIRKNSVVVTDGSMPMRVDGASLIIEGSAIEHNTDYEIQLSSLIKDMQGNLLDQDYFLPIRLDDLYLPSSSETNLRSPMVATLYPGYPCAFRNAVLSGPVEDWRNGRCVGGANSDPLWPIPTINTHYALRVIFSRNIDVDTVIEGQTFIVERRDVDGVTWQPVPGNLSLTSQRIEFRPNEAWLANALYRYTLKSNGNHRSSVADCGVTAICAPDGAPLQTRQLSQTSQTVPLARGGGPDMVNHFIPKDDDRTLVTLRALPTVDVNANLIHEPGQGEAKPLPGPELSSELIAPPNYLRLELASTSGVIKSGNLGCSIGTDCPENRFAFLGVGALQAELRDYDPSIEVTRRLVDGDPNTADVVTGAIRAEVLPSILTTTQVYLEAEAEVIITITIGLDTGPLVLRLDYESDAEGGVRPITGYITETDSGPWFSTSFDILIDAPELKPAVFGIEVGHDIRSKRIKNVTLEGPLRFIEDGRLLLTVSNPDPLIINAGIRIFDYEVGGVVLEVPPQAVNLTLSFLPVKSF